MCSSNNSASGVFLSYSRKDHVVCENLHANLKLQGLDVKIDIDDIPIGENIKQKIADLIVASNCSLVIVSKNSLQSTWVIWEIQRRMDLGEFGGNSKLIPVYLDKTYLDDHLANTILSEVHANIEQLIEGTAVLSRQGSDTDHLDSKRKSLNEFKHNFSQVLDYIRSTNAVDLRTENYLAGFNALYQAITGKAELENGAIITPPVFKNADKASRINEIEFLVAEANIKEAAKRVIDFVNDFYPGNNNYRKLAVKISSKAHDGEKNLPKGDLLMANNEKLVDEILDLIYAPLPEAM